MTLDLGVHTVNIKGTLYMSLYSPFWMINKTGLMLSYRVSVTIDIARSVYDHVFVAKEAKIVQTTYIINRYSNLLR